jgi:glycosyltransferase involved in cell wall biosynthesis
MFRPCLLIPVYNHEQALAQLLTALRPYALPCILVDDASSPESAEVLDRLALAEASWVQLFRHEKNQGKGGAVMTGVTEASKLGYSHALQIDADGQHAAEDIPRFLETGHAHQEAVICGVPQFDASAPKSRRWGRLLTNVWIWINTWSFDIQDGMCGFRLYPLRPLVDLFSKTKMGRRMDFDPELLVRLKWEKLEIISLPVKVQYPLDGLSHFKLGLDNWLISRMHTRLFFGMLARLAQLLKGKFAGSKKAGA